MYTKLRTNSLWIGHLLCVQQSLPLLSASPTAQHPNTPTFHNVKETKRGSRIQQSRNKHSTTNMSDPAASRTPATNGRGSAVRRGFEPYAPTARGANRRASGDASVSGGGDGHDTTRGRALWEDTSEDPGSRVPTGEKEWKRDRWDEDEASPAPSGRTPRGRGARAQRTGLASASASGKVVGNGASLSPQPASVPRGRGGVGPRGVGRDVSSSAAAVAVEPVSVGVEVPSGEQYEDISRRVEEEVVAKLARAQMMGMMLKAHREQEEERRVGTRGGGSSRRRRSDRGEAGMEYKGDRDHRHGGGDRDRDRGRKGQGGGGSGGRMVYEAPRQVLRHSDSGGKIGGRPSVRGGVGVGAGVGLIVQNSTPRSRQAPVGPGPRASIIDEEREREDRRYQRLGQDVTSVGVGVVQGAVGGNHKVGGAAAATNAAVHDAPTTTGEQHCRAGGTVSAPPQAAGLLRVPRAELSTGMIAAGTGSHPVPEDLGADPNGMSVEDTYVVVGKLERQHKSLLEEMRKEAGLVVTPRGGLGGEGSGPAAMAAAAAAATASSRVGQTSGAAGLSGRFSRVRGALSKAIGSLVVRDPALSLRKRLPNRLWMAHYRELEIIQQRLRQLGVVVVVDSGSQKQRKQQQQKALRTRLFVLIDEAERDIGSMVEEVERQIAAAEESRTAAMAATVNSTANSELRLDSELGVLGAPDSNKYDSPGHDGVDSAGGGAAAGSDDGTDDDAEGISAEEGGRRQALQAFLTSLGDLARYRCLHGDFGDGGNGGGGMGGWLRAEALYLRALRVDPASGKVKWFYEPEAVETDLEDLLNRRVQL